MGRLLEFENIGLRLDAQLNPKNRCAFRVVRSTNTAILMPLVAERKTSARQNLLFVGERPRSGGLEDGASADDFLEWLPRVQRLCALLLNASCFL
jgi:hypothetical protein